MLITKNIDHKQQDYRNEGGEGACAPHHLSHGTVSWQDGLKDVLGQTLGVCDAGAFRSGD